MLAATVVWAVSGAFRQTSIVFLAPLWLYSVFASGPAKRLPLYVLVAVPVALAWAIPNQHYQAAYAGDLETDVGHRFWQVQVMMPVNHDQTKLGLDEDTKGVTVSAYHWPFMEVAQWVDEETGAHVLPDYRAFGAPPPSLARATELAALQFGKLGFFLLFSLPALLVLVPLLPRMWRARRLLGRGESRFFLAWILPASVFFVVGHLGTFGYLQVFLSGWSVLTVLLLSRLCDASRKGGWRSWQIVHTACSVAALPFFMLAGPYQSANPREKLTDVLVLQYTGKAIQNRYAVARSLSNRPGPAEMEPWLRCRTDADIVRWFSTTDAAKVCLYKPHVVR
jgi:hypothetical protein